VRTTARWPRRPRADDEVSLSSSAASTFAAAGALGAGSRTDRSRLPGQVVETCLHQPELADALLDERSELTGSCRLAARLGDAG